MKDSKGNPAPSPAPAPPVPVEAIGRDASSATSYAAPSAEVLAALRGAPTIYVKRRETHRWEGLEVEVSSLEVKQDLDGREVLRTELALRAGEHSDSASFSGDDRVVAFAGYHVQVRGGSREAVGLAVIRTPAPR